VKLAICSMIVLVGCSGSEAGSAGGGGGAGGASPAGSGGACAEGVLPTSEQCNGLDDDCDGHVDEDLGATTCGLGICQTTASNCANGSPQACMSGDPNPAGETCDGVDDDCDGAVDEECTCPDGRTQACYSGNPTTVNVGACEAGTQTCADGRWGPCSGEVTPAPEKCDDIDNDCNGQSDDGNPQGGAACSTGGFGPCAPGLQQCLAGQLECVSTTEPTEEICNGIDDDCDEVIDNGQNPCGGACELVEMLQAPCDGRDGDACPEGEWQCAGPNDVTCSDTTPTQIEQCNNVDDDCDGTIDEGCP
jgi:hypothetical protein